MMILEEWWDKAIVGILIITLLVFGFMGNIAIKDLKDMEYERDLCFAENEHLSDDVLEAENEIITLRSDLNDLRKDMPRNAKMVDEDNKIYMLEDKARLLLEDEALIEVKKSNCWIHWMDEIDSEQKNFVTPSTSVKTIAYIFNDKVKIIRGFEFFQGSKVLDQGTLVYEYWGDSEQVICPSERPQLNYSQYNFLLIHGEQSD